MTPESIVTSLEWAIKLRNAGWPQEESHFTWVDSEGDISLHCGDFEWTPRIKATWFQFAAPTAEEILRRLPYGVQLKGGAFCYVTIGREEGGLFTMRVRRRNYGSSGQTGIGSAKKTPTVFITNPDTLANAAAQMACYLVEQGLLSFKND